MVKLTGNSNFEDQEEDGNYNTGLFKMIVRVLTTCYTQYT